MAVDPLPYFVALRQRALFIVPAKCASTSIVWALGGTYRPGRQGNVIPVSHDTALHLNAAGVFTVASVRHPLDRAVGAVYRLLPCSANFGHRLRELLEAGNIHVIPQLPIFSGFRIDHRLRFEKLVEDWTALRERIDVPELVHRNENIKRPKTWRAEIDWEPFMAYYAPDFCLNDEWDRP